MSVIFFFNINLMPSSHDSLIAQDVEILRAQFTATKMDINLHFKVIFLMFSNIFVCLLLYMIR